MASRVDMKGNLVIRILKNIFGEDVNKNYRVIGVREMSGRFGPEPHAEMKELGENAYDGVAHTSIAGLRDGIEKGEVVVV